MCALGALLPVVFQQPHTVGLPEIESLEKLTEASPFLSEVQVEMLSTILASPPILKVAALLLPAKTPLPKRVILLFLISPPVMMTVVAEVSQQTPPPT